MYAMIANHRIGLCNVEFRTLRLSRRIRSVYARQLLGYGLRVLRVSAYLAESHCVDHLDHFRYTMHSVEPSATFWITGNDSPTEPAEQIECQPGRLSVESTE